jgi:serine/threonine protein kinase
MSGNYYLDSGTGVKTDDAWYTVNREIGEGGNCVVYLVTQTEGEYRGNIHLEQEEPPVIHRDIKPENIFVRGETCYLGDFGLMKRKGEEGDGEMTSFYRSDDVAMNKYRYRTPDLVKYEREDIDEIPIESDVFQLGLVLIELFTENNWNPQQPTEEPLSDVEIDPQAYEYIRIPEGMGGGIGNLLSDMITIDHSDRPMASELMDSWMGIFRDAAEMSQDLHGRVF